MSLKKNHSFHLDDIFSTYFALLATFCPTEGDSWNGGTTLEFLSAFLWRAPPLEMRRERRNFFPTKQGKDPSSRARRRKRGSPGCVRDPRASSRVETGVSGTSRVAERV